jgi:hypothetical protein
MIISFSRFSQKPSTLGHMLLHESYISATIAVFLAKNRVSSTFLNQNAKMIHLRLTAT